MDLIPENYYVQELGTSYQLPVWQVETGKGIVPMTNEDGQVNVQTIQFVRGDKREQEIELLKNSGETAEDGTSLWLDEEGNRYYAGSPSFYKMPAMEISQGEGKPNLIVPMPPEGEEIDYELAVSPKDAITDTKNPHVQHWIAYTIKEVTIPRVPGIVYEALLGVMVEDLKYKNELVPSRETAIAITKLEEAALWLAKRSADRQKRQVQGTYKS